MVYAYTKLSPDVVLLAGYPDDIGLVITLDNYNRMCLLSMWQIVIADMDPAYFECVHEALRSRRGFKQLKTKKIHETYSEQLSY